MNQKYHLFSLIKSLSKSEKRYFKTLCQSNGSKENIYILLFDAIEKQKKYNEEEIKKQFAKEKSITQFAVYKKYLLKKVLESLRAYHNNSTIHIRLNELFTNIEILITKGLIDFAKKMLNNVEKLCEEHHIICYNTLIIYLKKSLIFAHRDDKYIANIEKLQTIIDKQAQEYSTQHKYFTLYAKTVRTIYAPRLNKQDKINLINNELDPFLSKQEVPTDYKTLQYYYGLLSICALYLGNIKICLIINKLILDSQKENLKKPSLDEIMTSLVPSYANYIIYLSVYHYTDDFNFHLQEFKKIGHEYKRQNAEIQKRIDYFSFSHKLNHLVFNPDKNEITQLLEEIRTPMQDVEKYPIIQNRILFYMALHSFMLEKIETSLEILYIKTNQSANRHDGFFATSELLHIVCHYEAKNYEYVYNKAQYHYKIAPEKARDTYYWRAIYKLFINLSSAIDDKHRVQILKEYLPRIQELYQYHEFWRHFKYIDIKSFILAKLQNRSYFDVFKESRGDNPPPESLDFNYTWLLKYLDEET